MTNNTGKGFVLYDGSCGFCSWWIPFWKKTINKTGFDIAPLQAKCLPAKASAQAGVKEIHLTNELLNKDIVLLLKS